MVVQNQAELGKGSTIPTDPQHTPTIIESSSQPQKTQKPRKPKRKDTQVPQPSDPSDNVADEAVHKELGDSLVMSTTTASSLEVECKETMRDIIAQTRFENVSKLSNDSLLVIVSTAATTVTITTEEITLAQALKSLKTSKPKVKMIVFQEPGESTTTKSTQTISSQQSQDKGKGIMIEEPVKPMKKKDLIRLDEEVALKLQAEFDEEERLAREKAEKEKEANIALIEEWDDIQAKIEADHELAQRLQAEEQEELSDAEKATLFQQLLEKRRKHFAAKRAEEQRNKPPTQAQQRKIMCTYLKNMEGKKLKDLKNKSFDSIQKMFDRAFKRVNTFVDFRTDLVEGSSKRAGEELEQESTKKQKVDEDKDTTELQSLMEVIPDEEEVAIDVVPLATKSPSIVDWKIHKEGKKSYYQIVRADGKSQIPVEDMNYLLWNDMKIMFEPYVEDEIWKLQQGYNVLEWKIYDSCGVHSLRMFSVTVDKLKYLEEVSDRFVAPCFVNGLEAYDGEINLGVEENMISNEYAVKIIDHLLYFNIDDIPLLGEEGLLPFVCKMGKTSRNKKRAMENLNFFYQDIGTSSSARGFLRTIGGIVNTPERRFSTFDGFCHQTFRVARLDFMRNVESDSDDEEDYQIKRNKFGAPIYGPKPAPYLNSNDPDERSLAIQNITNPFWKISVWKKADSFLSSLPILLKQTIGTHDDEAGSSRSKHSKQHETVEELIYAELCHEFYSTYEFDEVCVDDELQTKEIIKFRLGGRAHSLTLLEFAHRLGLYHADELKEDSFNVTIEESHTSTIRNPILRVIHKMITYGLCQRMTGYDKIQKNDFWLLKNAGVDRGLVRAKVLLNTVGDFYTNTLRDFEIETLMDRDTPRGDRAYEVYAVIALGQLQYTIISRYPPRATQYQQYIMMIDE
ncbi:hypothetical protein Tco_1068268 [Tanacetum coccineum]|uniref:Uncharacterized protein n=1 Tax=Tanacetum coccineum TaxID=301880 RepID=A0ABQ5HF97_9ASTR